MRGHAGNAQQASVGATVPLPAVHGTSAGQYVGSPSDLLSYPSEPLPPAPSTPPAVSQPMQALMLALTGQQAACGPFLLTAPLSRLMHVQVQIARPGGVPHPPTQTLLAVEIAPDHHGGCSIMAHSGLQVCPLCDKFLLKRWAACPAGQGSNCKVPHFVLLQSEARRPCKHADAISRIDSVHWSALSHVSSA